ncbi:hypothetical protein Catovirus_2_306 [Catovirus CTV1]|uniref:Uncharacterized protein n=1 Tax=Catovirus CTV1 TaxID=1977631 RepID=A0A1V0SCC4_9VIRU|nr:hypothetical protein Catovirus_2_306 [Catovirus CTV1]
MSKMIFQNNTNYSKLFNESYCFTNNEIKLSDRHCGKTSVYEIALRWLKTLYEANNKDTEANRILVSKLSFMIPLLEEILAWSHECHEVSFVRDLLLVGPKFFDAPERREKIPLGEAGLELMSVMLVSRVNTVAVRAVSRMSYRDNENKEHYYECVTELGKYKPVYFDWKDSTSETHLDFALDVMKWWRTLDERVTTLVTEVIEETKALSQKYKEQKKQDKLSRTKEMDLEALNNYSQKKKEEVPHIIEYAPISASNINVWKKLEQPKPVEQTQQQKPKMEKKQSNKRKNNKPMRNNKQKSKPVEVEEEVSAEQQQENEKHYNGDWQVKKRRSYKKQEQVQEDNSEPQKNAVSAVRRRQFVLRGPKKPQQTA